MIIEGAAGVLGIASMSLSVGGAAFILASLVPVLGGAIATLTLIGGMHTWLTRK